MHGLFPCKTKKVLQLLLLFKKPPMSVGTNKAKYGLIKPVNFKIDQLKDGFRIMI